MTAAEAAQVLGVTRQRIHQFVKEGRIRVARALPRSHDDGGRFTYGGRQLVDEDVRRLARERGRVG